MSVAGIVLGAIGMLVFVFVIIPAIIAIIAIANDPSLVTGAVSLIGVLA
ncbi:MAG: hypothetical protein FWD76_01415 [Firmicutes bacterium]|nr:hypothetical protein [Bacillota bacterium]